MSTEIEKQNEAVEIDAAKIDAKERLAAAKFPLESVLQPAQLLRFDSSTLSTQSKLLLMELPDANILDYIENGDKLVIRGHPTDDTAVVCTDVKTYDLKEVKTSNTLILLEELETSPGELRGPAGEFSCVKKKACCVKDNYLELKQKIPDFSRMKEIISKTLYKGPIEEEEYSQVEKLTTNDLCDIIPASFGEIKLALRDMGACEIEGHWRVLHFEYLTECISTLLYSIHFESWSCSKFDINELCSLINDEAELIPNVVIHHVVALYGDVTSPHESGFVENKLCKFFAELLLQTQDSYDFDYFMQVWSESLPGGMDVNEDYLSGIALVDRKTKPTTIKKFSRNDLPLSKSKRFELLFSVREKWTLRDISPYLEDLCVEGEKITSLLTKYARSSITAGEKLFSSRKCFG